MADKKISQLSAAGALTGTELVPITQGGSTVKTTAQDIADFVGGGVKVYRALLTQLGTDAPVATVLENTLGGEVVWSYISTGLYNGALISAFPSGKTGVFIGGRDDDNANTWGINSAWRASNDSVVVATKDNSATYDDGNLVDTMLQILVYP